MYVVQKNKVSGHVNIPAHICSPPPTPHPFHGPSEAGWEDILACRDIKKLLHIMVVYTNGNTLSVLSVHSYLLKYLSYT